MPQLQDAALSRDLAVLSAMITPTILILATASLIGTTVSRLLFIITTNRELTEHTEKRAQHEAPSEVAAELLAIHRIIDTSTVRIRLMQVTLVILHVAIALFVLTTVALGVLAYTQLEIRGLPVVLGLAGALLLLVVAIILIFDARLGLQTADAETHAVVERIDRKLDAFGPRSWRLR